MTCPAQKTTDDMTSYLGNVEAASAGRMSQFTIVTDQPTFTIIWDERETCTEHPWSRNERHKATISTPASGVNRGCIEGATTRHTEFRVHWPSYRPRRELRRRTQTGNATSGWYNVDEYTATPQQRRKRSEDIQWPGASDGNTLNEKWVARIKSWLVN
jgi:hypothetical protein